MGRCRDGVGLDYGRRLCAELARAASQPAAAPALLCVEKPFLDAFLDALEAEALPKASALPAVRFELLLVNDGNVPRLRSALARIGAVGVPRGLLRCFATNLHTPEPGPPSALFRPLPLGLPRGGSATCDRQEELLAAAHARAPPWAQRDARLLCAPMRPSSRLRAAYLRALGAPACAHLVRVVRGPLPLEAFLQLLAAHRATLSPPGRGLTASARGRRSRSAASRSSCPPAALTGGCTARRARSSCCRSRS